MKNLLLLLLATVLASPIAWAHDGDDVQVRHSEAYAGGMLAVEGAETVYWWGVPQVQGLMGGPAARTGDTMEVSWMHQAFAEPEPQRITVRLERSPGQTLRTFRNRFHDMVMQALELYPPNTPDEHALMAGDIVFSDWHGRPTAHLPYSPPWAGGTVTAPGRETTMGGPAGGGAEDTMSISWKHDPDGPGPLEPITVTASTEARSGETFREQARRLGQMREALMEVFPPNAPGPKTGG